MKILFPKKSNFSKKKNFYYAIVLYFLSPFFVLYAYLKIKNKLSTAKQWKSGIIVGPTHIGDLLFFTSSLKLLAQELPQCKWYCVTEGYSAQALANNPYITGIVYIKSQKDLFNKNSEAQKQIKLLNPDAAIIMMRNNYFTYLLSAVGLGIPNRIGYGDKGLEYLLTCDVPPPKEKRPHSAYYRGIIEHLCSTKSVDELRPEVYPSIDDHNLAVSFVAETFKETQKTHLVVVFASGKTTNCNWTIQYYQHFVTLILTELNANVLLCGSKSDYELLHSIANKNIGPVQVAAGNLKLLQLACVMERALFVFGPDSGPRHIANAVKTPALFIPNLNDSEIENGTYCDTEINLIPNYSFLSETEANAMINDLTPKKVISIVKQKVLYKVVAI